MAAEILVAVAAGAASALIVVALGRFFRLGFWRVVIGAVCLALLVGLGVADLLVGGFGKWWAERPLAAAGLSGLLFLAITVLVVEALIEHVDARRLTPAGRAAVEGVLDAAGLDSGPLKPLQRILTNMKDADHPAGLKEPVDLSPGYLIDPQVMDAIEVDAQIGRVVAESAAVLTATGHLIGLYDRALTAADAVHCVAQRLEAYRNFVLEHWEEHGREDMSSGPGWHEKVRALGADDRWASVLDAWPQVVSAFDDLEREAHERVTIALYSNPVWRRPLGPVDQPKPGPPPLWNMPEYRWPRL